MALAAVTTEEVAGPEARSLSDDDVVTVLRREAKRRAEAAEAFNAGGRPELADRENAEREVIVGYLPAELPEGELAGLVRASIDEAVAADGPSGPGMLGPVMRIAQAKVAGRASGGRVAAEVRRQLGS